MVTQGSPTVRTIPHWIGGRDCPSASGETIEKRDPATGRLLCLAARGRKEDAGRALLAARGAFEAWARETVEKRGEDPRQAAILLEERREEIASIVARETGKFFKDACGEVSRHGDAG